MKILFLTGTRADFSKLEPLAIVARDAGHNVNFFVTGMHMMARYGLTKIEVHRVQGVQVHEFLNQRPGDPQDVILAKTMLGFSDFVTEMRPDLIVVHGDRIEALAGAMVGATNYIRTAHIEGGEVSGTIDEVLRHCNTKLATHHFVSSEAAKRRILALGESDDSVHVIGSPELDYHARPSGVTLDAVRARYEIPYDDYGIAIFHPVTSEQSRMETQAEGLFKALATSGRNFVVIAPNNDPGSNAVFAALDKLPSERFRVLPSMRFSYFSELMRNAAVMVGNSSAGVREAPFFGLASLDIGTRQTNRALAASVHNCAATDQAGIAAFLRTEWGKRYPADLSYGEGRAAALFLATLSQDGFWQLPLQKSFNDSGI